MKIGVIGYTHNIKTLNDLPPRARLALTDVDLVLHVGRVGNLTFLRDLQDTFGLTFAIYSDQDPDEVKRYLEADKVVEFANRRIGMTFSVSGTEQNLKLLSLKRQAITPDSLAQQLLAKFENVDCVVFGSPLGSFNHLYKGILVFNPGPIIHEKGDLGSMGILEITERAMTGRIVPL